MATFTAQLDAFVVKTEGDLQEVLTKSILTVYAKLKDKSPVDTGRFRNNWMYGVDAIPVGTTEAVTGAPAPAVPEKAYGHVHFIANNLPYANRLENGWSNQAPQGMVGLTVIEWPQIVAEAVASVRQ